jgi:SAM-dependent methyltransferase
LDKSLVVDYSWRVSEARRWSQLSTYDATRQAWRDIWINNADFERELATLDYVRSQELIHAYLPYLSRDTVILEAGCGLGHVVYYLRQCGYHVIGVDYAAEALQPEIIHKLQLPVTVADVHHLPYADNSLGGYLSFGVVEHFEAGPEPALREAFRVLKPGGALVLTVPHPNFVEASRAVVNRLIPGRLARVGKRAEYFETEYDHAFSIQRSIPLSHSYTWYGVGPIFRAPGYYQTSALAEFLGRLGARLLPWKTSYVSLTIARKP